MVDVGLLFCSTLFCFVERTRVFASLVEVMTNLNANGFLVKM